MFLVPNIDQMYKKMKKIVEVGNGDDFANLFFFGIKNARVGRPETHIFFFGLICIFILKKKAYLPTLPFQVWVGQQQTKIFLSLA